MKSRIEIIKKEELSRHQIHQNVEEKLSLKLGLPSIRAGNVTIRNKNGFRVNQKQIDYCWLVNISRSFIGWCWLFSIKLNETNYREINNPEQLIQGIFTIDNNRYSEIRSSKFQDKIKELNTYDMFDANNGITLDGIGYEYLIFALNSEIRISLNNPNSENWKIWEKTVWDLGRELGRKSGITEYKEIFE